MTLRELLKEKEPSLYAALEKAWNVANNEIIPAMIKSCSLGLDLFISKTFIASMKGKINIKNTIRFGDTTFIFKF